MGNNPSIRILWLALLFQACSFDHDAGFLPQWKATWWVVQDSTGLSLARVDSAGVAIERGAAIPKAMQLNNDELWTIDLDNFLSLREPVTASVQSRWAIPGGNGLDLTIGLRHIYVSTGEDRLWMFDPREETWSEIALPGKSGLLMARSDRCLVVVDDTMIVKIQEQSMAIRESIPLSSRVKSLQNDGGHLTWVLHEAPEGSRLSRIDYHPEKYNFLGTALEADSLLVSPIIRSRFGTEYLDHLEVNSNCLSQPPDLCGEAFWPFWEQSEIFILRSDSLLRYHLESGELISSFGPFSGNILDGVNVVE